MSRSAGPIRRQRPLRGAGTRIIAYGAAAIADGTRVVAVDSAVSITGVQEGDRFAVDANGRSAVFNVISVGLQQHRLELDRPLPRGCFGWSIQRDADADRQPAGQSEWLVTAGEADAALPGCTTLEARGDVAFLPCPQPDQPERVTRQQTRDASTMWFDGKTRIERFVPRDPHLSNEANLREGNEATFAFWLNRSATVIRPETLMIAVDHISGEAFSLVLHPAPLRTRSPAAPYAIDLEVTPKSGSDARPVRWTIAHPQSSLDWQFLALITDREGGVSLWVDGQSCGRQQSTTGIAHHDYLALGDQPFAPCTANQESPLGKLIPTGLRDTLLDDFAAWSRRLNDEELRRAMIATPLAATRDGSLQLYWRMSATLHDIDSLTRRPVEAARRRVDDVSGTARHGMRHTELQGVQQNWRGVAERCQPWQWNVGLGVPTVAGTELRHHPCDRSPQASDELKAEKFDQVASVEWTRHDIAPDVAWSKGEARREISHSHLGSYPLGDHGFPLGLRSPSPPLSDGEGWLGHLT